MADVGAEGFHARHAFEIQPRRYDTLKQRTGRAESTRLGHRHVLNPRTFSNLFDATEIQNAIGAVLTRQCKNWTCQNSRQRCSMSVTVLIESDPRACVGGDQSATALGFRPAGEVLASQQAFLFGPASVTPVGRLRGACRTRNGWNRYCVQL